MKKHDLLRSGDNIVRVLDIQQERVFVIECINRKMPVWMESELLESYVRCTDGEIFEISGVDVIRDTDALDADQRKIMHERYTMIAPILPFISDDKVRSKLICSIAEESKVSKQTIRSYLCLYLSYLDITVLRQRRQRSVHEYAAGSEKGHPAGRERKSAEPSKKQGKNPCKRAGDRLY